MPPKEKYTVRLDDEEAITNWYNKEENRSVLHVQLGHNSLNKGDQCCLVYAHKPNPFDMLGGPGNDALHFEYMKFMWSAASDS